MDNLKPPGFRAAIAGSGPAAVFAADELLRRWPGASVDLFERLPAPFGLVRYGVSPDHPHTRKVMILLQSVLDKPGVRLHLGAEVGTTHPLADLRREYDAVILAHGAADDRVLNLPGEDLAGVWPSLAFAGWANGHPDFAHRGAPPHAETAVILGNGNVALDVARLLARSADFLATTDIAPAAREALGRSALRRIVIAGRRGPAQAAFGLTELEEVAGLPGWHVSAEASSVPLDPASVEEVEKGDDRTRGVCALLERLARAPAAPATARRIDFLFHRAPVAFLGGPALTRVRLQTMRLEGPAGAQRAVATDRFEEIDAGFAVKAVGHVGRPLAGAPFDPVRGVIPTQASRVLEDGHPIRGLYAAGWIKRGAKGLIGHNRRDAAEVIASLRADFQ